MGSEKIVDKYKDKISLFKVVEASEKNIISDGEINNFIKNVDF